MPVKHQHEQVESVPKALRERDQWIVTWDKDPIHPTKTGWNTPEVQLSFQQAQDIARQRRLEVGYVLRAEDPFVILDFDDVGSDGSFSDEVMDIVADLDTYTEISRSGTGLHCVCRGARLSDRQRKGELVEQGQIEVDDANRHVVLTGNQFGSYAHITPDDDSSVPAERLQQIQRMYLPERDGSTDQDGVYTGQGDPDSCSDVKETSENTGGVDARRVYRTIKAYADDGRECAQRACELWDSSPGSAMGYPSGSEADFALVSDLAFWCRNDARLIDNCFRESNRTRAKWDEVHYSNGQTYGEETIRKAIKTNGDTFSGHYVN